MKKRIIKSLVRAAGLGVSLTLFSWRWEFLSFLLVFVPTFVALMKWDDLSDRAKRVVVPTAVCSFVSATFLAIPEVVTQMVTFFPVWIFSFVVVWRLLAMVNYSACGPIRQNIVIWIASLGAAVLTALLLGRWFWVLVAIFVLLIRWDRLSERARRAAIPTGIVSFIAALFCKPAVETSTVIAVLFLVWLLSFLAVWTFLGATDYSTWTARRRNTVIWISTMGVAVGADLFLRNVLF